MESRRSTIASDVAKLRVCRCRFRNSLHRSGEPLVESKMPRRGRGGASCRAFHEERKLGATAPGSSVAKRNDRRMTRHLAVGVTARAAWNQQGFPKCACNILCLKALIC
jgi:hypothetical protein